MPQIVSGTAPSPPPGPAARQHVAQADARSTGSSTGRPGRHTSTTGSALRRGPIPGAFTWLDDEKVVVWRALPVELSARARAGTVVEARPEGPVVACGDGGLLLEEFETQGRLEVGAVLG